MSFCHWKDILVSFGYFPQNGTNLFKFDSDSKSDLILAKTNLSALI